MFGLVDAPGGAVSTEVVASPPSTPVQVRREVVCPDAPRKGGQSVRRNAVARAPNGQVVAVTASDCSISSLASHVAELMMVPATEIRLKHACAGSRCRGFDCELEDRQHCWWKWCDSEASHISAGPAELFVPLSDRRVKVLVHGKVVTELPANMYVGFAYRRISECLACAPSAVRMIYACADGCAFGLHGPDKHCKILAPQAAVHAAAI